MSAKIIMPPQHPYTRARKWNTFEALFDPVVLPDGSLIRDPSAVPADADPRFWWTVLDPMTGTLYLATGFHLVNRLGYILCRNPWGGDPFDHPEYLY